MCRDDDPARMIVRSLDIDEDSWGFQYIAKSDKQRAQRLESAGSTDDLVVALNNALHCAIKSGDVRFAVDAIGNQFEQSHRAIIQFNVESALYDWFFNGRTGYRALFWCAPDVGAAFNRRIVKALLVTLRKSLQPASFPVFFGLLAKTLPLKSSSQRQVRLRAKSTVRGMLVEPLGQAAADARA